MARTPTEVLREFDRAREARRWLDAAGLCHPELVERTASHLRGPSARFLAWVHDGLSDVELLAETIRRNDLREIFDAHCRELRALYPRLGDLVDRLESRHPVPRELGTFHVVGDIIEEDVAYVLARETSTVTTRFWGRVWMLKRHDDAWKVWSEDIELGFGVIPDPLVAEFNGKLRQLYPTHSQWSP